MGSGVALDPPHVLDGHREDDVELAREEGGHPGRVGLDRLEDDLVQIVGALAPPAIEAPGGRPDVDLAAGDGEGARAVGVHVGIGTRRIAGSRRMLGPVREGPLPIHDVPGVPLGIEDRVGRLRDEVDGAVVDLDDLHDAREAGFQVRARLAGPRRREQHVVRIERVAVLELDALAQMEAPARRLDDLPALGKARDKGEIGTASHQPLVDVAQIAEREGLVQAVGIEAADVAAGREPKGLAGHRCRDEEDERSTRGTELADRHR